MTHVFRNKLHTIVLCTAYDMKLGRRHVLSRMELNGLTKLCDHFKPFTEIKNVHTLSSYECAHIILV